MRVLIVAPGYVSATKSRAYTFVHARARGYIKFGDQVQVFVPPTFASSIRSLKEVALSYIIDDVKVSKAPWSYFPKVASDFEPEVIAVHASNGLWLNHILEVGKPMVLWVHGAEALIEAFFNYYFPFSIRANVLKGLSLATDFLKLIFFRRFLLMSDAVVYVSQWMRKIVEKYIGVRHPAAFVIPNAIETNTFRRTNFDVETRRNKGISVRAFGWKYGLDTAVLAYSNLEGTCLTIIGIGPLERYLRKLANKYKSNVKIKTEVIPHDGLSVIFNEYGYFVAPSRTEAQGVAMCEAMACGLPVIATKVGGIPEFVVDRFNGLLVPPENPKELRRAVKLLVSDSALHRQLSENAINFVNNKLSCDKILRKEREVLKLAKDLYESRHARKFSQNVVI